MSTSCVDSVLTRSRARIVVLALTVLIGPFAWHAHAQEATGITFFKSYPITGDYVLNGVGVRALTPSNGVVSSSITISGVPANATILAAFLYWETVVHQNSPDEGHVGAKFKGNLLSSSTQTNLAKILNPQGTAPCWASGGATGGSEGAHQAFVYRADVLRFFDQDPVTGRLAVNGTHTFDLPDGGGGNQVPSAAGASLLVIYRDPSLPLRAIVIYNGGFTLDQSTQQMTRTIQGIYQASTTSTPIAKMSHIVANGSSFSERLRLDGTLVATNPFTSAAGDGWDNPTFDITGKLASGASSTVVNVDHTDTPFDCLTWGAIIVSTTVQDADQDGIIDIQETSVVSDPNGNALPNLAAMGATPTKKDIFVEIGYTSTAGYTNPIQGQVAAHDHKPSLAALQLVANAFANAPVPNPDQTTGIRVHFDVGNNYQTPTPPSFIIPAAHARGGESVDETACTQPWDHDGDPTTPLQPCQFPDFPGTIAWKNAYRFLRDQPLNYTYEQDCVAAGSLCVRRFDANRRDVFRYALFAHALGLPKSTDPASPDYHIPRNVSGIADPPGADILITLGLWGKALDNYKGDDYTQASTLMHELGHNLALKHGGQPVLVDMNGVPIPEPNCKPNYQSVMNYLFQMRGLVCLANTTASACANQIVGTTVVDYARGTRPALDENALSEASSGLGTLFYPTRWWAPKTSSFLDTYLQTPAATRRCNGSLAQGENMVMIDGTSLSQTIDWTANGFILAAPGTVTQDVNYSGAVPSSAFTVLNAATDDWQSVDLRQVGARRNVGSYRIGGSLSVGIDWPDLGFGDTGFGDTGFGDTGFGDTGFGDTGFGDTGFGDTGFGDTGFGDTGFGDTGAPQGDLDLDTAISYGNAPSALTGTVQTKSITLTWRPPHSGNVTNYELFKAVAAVIGPTTPIIALATVTPPVSGLPTYVDTAVKNNVTYTYFVIANFDNGQSSSRSNFFTITK